MGRARAPHPRASDEAGTGSRGARCPIGCQLHLKPWDEELARIPVRFHLLDALLELVGPLMCLQHAELARIPPQVAADVGRRHVHVLALRSLGDPKRPRQHSSFQHLYGTVGCAQQVQIGAASTPG